MKVYIILVYKDDRSCKVDSVYASEQDAKVRVTRLINERGKILMSGQSTSIQTFHILKKSVKGLFGIKAEVNGQSRVIRTYTDGGK